MKITVALLALCIITISSAQSATSARNSNPCSALSLSSSYDVIVVGTGPGGAVAARRIAENNPTFKVLSVERGEYYSECQLCSNAFQVFANDDDPNNHLTINFAPQAYIPGNPVISFPDASVQGGASSINGMFHIRGTARYFFNQFFPTNFNWHTMKTYYEKYENYSFPAGFYGPDGFDYAANNRGNSGPVKINQKQVSDANGFLLQWNRVIADLFPSIPVYQNGSVNNGDRPGIGASPTETDSDGNTRSSAYPSYLGSYSGTNIKSIAHVRVNKVLFQGTQVTGVELTFMNTSTGISYGKTCNVSSSNVIVSAGALGTPKLLLLSGIGDSAKLNSLNIPVVVNNPNVGANLHDHFGMLLPTAPGGTPIPVQNNTAQDWGWAFWNTQNNADLPLNFNIEYICSGANGPNNSVGYINPDVVFATSTGVVSINSSDANVQAFVELNYLATENDRNVITYALQKSIALKNMLGLAGFDPCTLPGANCSNPTATLNQYLTVGLGGAGYHYTGTAAICSVVNPLHLNVKGTKGLYVLDASIMPLSPSGNTMSPTYAVAERGIELIQDAILNGFTESAADFSVCTN